jgi:5-methylcytosine-specific restriction endonuclease McrA
VSGGKYIGDAVRRQKVKLKIALRQGGKLVQTGERKRRLLTPCFYCGNRFRLGLLTFDHVKPRSEGGGSTQDNLVLACPDCNNSRNPDFKAKERRALRARQLGVSIEEIKRRDRAANPVIHVDGRDKEVRLIGATTEVIGRIS